MCQVYFTVTVQCTMGPFPTVWKFSTVLLPTCILQAANVTLKKYKISLGSPIMDGIYS